MVVVDKSTAQVAVVSIPKSSAHIILKAGMRADDTVTVDAPGGTILRFVQKPLAELVIILTVALFEDSAPPMPSWPDSEHARRHSNRVSKRICWR